MLANKTESLANTRNNSHNQITIGQENDHFEQEADQIADQVVMSPNITAETIQMSGNDTFTPFASTSSNSASDLQMKCEACEGQKLRTSQVEHVGTQVNNSVHPDIEQKIKQCIGTGKSLDKAVEQEMVVKLGYNFDEIRIHDDKESYQLADVLHAKAFTFGNDIFFGKGYYNPYTETGHYLLVHELVHTLQQYSSQVEIIQRAEVDDRSCINIFGGQANDGMDMINKMVNKRLDDIRKEIPKWHTDNPNITEDQIKDLFLERVWIEIAGGNSRGGVSKIERNLKNHQFKDAYLTPTQLTFNQTKYEGVGGNVFSINVGQLSEVMNIQGTCVGTDKLGHFFAEGFIYYEMLDQKKSVEEAGRYMELRAAGIESTGVYSNADLLANEAGLKFYNKLSKDIHRYEFNIAHYFDQNWNESINPNYYRSDIGPKVWENLLTGRWIGQIDLGGIPLSNNIDIIDLAQYGSGSITGNYSLGTSPGKKGLINGSINYNVRSISGDFEGWRIHKTDFAESEVIVGISIDFSWSDVIQNTSGHGTIRSKNEMELEGTWGFDKSTDDGGLINLKKV